jgi:acetyl esterase/lipase
VIVRILGSVVLALLRRVFHRLRRGPAVASWGWGVELRMVALRAFLDAARDHPDPAARSRIEGRVDPPLPRRLRRVMSVATTRLAALETELHRPVASGLAVEPYATLLYFHGGGYVAGSAATHRRWVANLSWGIGADAYVPDYRLAPQHRFPAAVDDALAAFIDVTSRGVAPSRLFVAGDSAGGGLALALLLRLRDEGLQLPAGAILFSPYTDLEHTAPSLAENQETDYLPSFPGGPVINTYYLGDHDPRDPYASPLYGDYSGIPPLLVFAGGREMIRDDSIRLVDVARSAGCDARLHIAPDMYHVWPALLPNHAETLRAIAIARAFVGEVCAGSAEEG